MPSLKEHTESLKQTTLRGEIAVEKTTQLQWDLKREKQGTQQSYLKYQQSKRQTGIERERLTQSNLKLAAEKHRTSEAAHERDRAGIRAGIAHDSLQASRAERGVKQMLLREQLTRLALQASTLQQENTQAIASFKHDYKKPPRLQSVKFLSGGI
jgi:hypothetical protein